MTHHLTEKMQDCIESCANCSGTCVETLSYCMSHGGEYVEASHMRLLLDCADICQITANFLRRGSLTYSQVCRTCADICQVCAESCRFVDDKLMTKCSEICEECAATCEMVVTAASKGAKPRSAQTHHLL